VLAGTLCALPIPQITNPASNNITLRLIPALISPVYAPSWTALPRCPLSKPNQPWKREGCPSLPGGPLLLRPGTSLGKANRVRLRGRNQLSRSPVRGTQREAKESRGRERPNGGMQSVGRLN
jgi:hypothetical protein